MHKNLKSRFDQTRTWANRNEGFVGLIGIVVGSVFAIASVVIGSLSSGESSPFKEYGAGNVCIGIALCLILVVGLGLIYLGLRKCRSESVILLNQMEAAKPSTWHPNNNWTSEQGILRVTDSMFGGLCTTGTKWQDYEFSFEFKIVNKCAGWIVRGKSRDHHVMIQCNDRQQIRPHIRAILSEGDVPRYKVIKEMLLRYSLDEWNKGKTVVTGNSIEVWIGGMLAWSDADVLGDFASGTVGFRCADDEMAQFRNIQVVRR